MKKAILLNVQTAALKQMLSKSTSLTEGILNITITSDKISSIATNKAESFFKKWEIELASVSSGSEGDPIDEIKISIFKGVDFIKTVLPYFGKECSLTIEHIDGKATSIFISNDKLGINLVTGSVDMNFCEFTDETMSQIFEPSSEVAKFTLGAEELVTINSLSKLDTNPETQTKFVRIYTEEGKLKATDNAFDIILHDTDVVIDTDINLNKELLKLYCAEDYNFTVFNEGQESTLLAESDETKTTCSLILMVDSLESSADDVDSLSDEFTWGE